MTFQNDITNVLKPPQDLSSKDRLEGLFIAVHLLQLFIDFEHESKFINLDENQGIILIDDCLIQRLSVLGGVEVLLVHG